MTPRKRRPGEKLRSLYLWHRYIGLIAALLAAWLAATGIVLNHADDLELAQKHVGSEWLLSLYGLEAPRNLRGREIAGHWLVEAGGRIYLDTQPVATGDVVDAAATEHGFVLAFADQLQLYTASGALIETLPFTASPASIEALAPAPDGGLFVVTAAATFRTDAALTSFTRLEPPPAVATIPLQALPPELERSIARHAYTHMLSWERVLLDAHAGRIAGRAGVWLADIAGIALLLLAASGVLVWLQRRRNGKK